MAAPVLRKVKAVGIGALVALVGGLGVYLTNDVNWVEAFGIGIGGVISTAIGFGVREGFPRLIEYLNAQKDVDVEIIEEPFPVTQVKE
jgi:hypothetical protein